MLNSGIKKRISVLLCIVTVLTLSFMLTGTAADEPYYRLGDLNGDSRIMIEDARQCLRGAVGIDILTESQKKAADIFGDGKIKIVNARKILRAAVGIEFMQERDIELQVGQSYTFVPLQNAGSGKYNWSYSSNPEDGLDITYSTYDTGAGTGKDGAPVETTYTFTAQAPGTYTIHLRLAAINEFMPIDGAMLTIIVSE